MLENVFVEIIRMSIIASVAAVLVIIFRWIFNRKLSKAINYALWVIVFLRLVIPSSFISPISLIGKISAPEAIVIQRNNIEMSIVSGDSSAIENSGSMPSNTTKEVAKEKLNILPIATKVWVYGAIGLILFSIYTYLAVSRKLEQATLYEQSDLLYECKRSLGIKREVKIYTSNKLSTPIVCGILRPHIILPECFIDGCSIQELKHIIIHELVHIKRYDYLIKPLAALVLCIYWFNPLMWLCFKLLQKDMEMSCDERVLFAEKRDIRREYANSLLNISIRQNNLSRSSLLAFGDSHIKSRIKGIMNYKNKKVGITIIAVIILIAVIVVLMTNGRSNLTSNVIAPKSIEVENSLNNMLEHRTKSLDSVEDAKSLLETLTYGDNVENVSLDKKGVITIEYYIDNVAEQMQNVEPILQDNALIIFSLVEDINRIELNIGAGGKNLISDYNYSYQRKVLQQYFENDLWSYSSDKELFYRFMMDISFEILVYPKEYSPAMSIVPGMRIDVSLNAVYYEFDKVEYSTQNKSLRTMNDGKLSEFDNIKRVDHGPVYWLPHDMDINEDTITISILDKEGNIIIEKTILVVKENNWYMVKPSYDIITDNLYQ